MNIQEINDSIKSCKRCVLGEALVVPLHALTGRGGSGKILGIGQSPDFDCHLLELPYSTQNEMTLKGLLSSAEILKKDFYYTNVIKCSGADSAKQISSSTKVCIEHLMNEINILNPQWVVAFGTKTSELLRRFAKDVKFTELNSLSQCFLSPKKFKENVVRLKSLYGEQVSKES